MSVEQEAAPRSQGIWGDAGPPKWDRRDPERREGLGGLLWMVYTGFIKCCSGEQGQACSLWTFRAIAPSPWEGFSVVIYWRLGISVCFVPIPDTCSPNIPWML